MGRVITCWSSPSLNHRQGRKSKVFASPPLPHPRFGAARQYAKSWADSYESQKNKNITYGIMTCMATRHLCNSNLYIPAAKTIYGYTRK